MMVPAMVNIIGRRVTVELMRVQTVDGELVVVQTEIH